MQTPALPLATALQLLLKSRQVSQELTWAVLACSQGLPGLAAGPGSAGGMPCAWQGEQEPKRELRLGHGAGGSVGALVWIRNALSSPVLRPPFS